MSEALDLLVGVFRSPARAPALRTRELPDGMLEAIRIAAGDAEAIAAARAATPLSEADLGVAASLLLQHLLFFEGADSYRTLGVHRDTDLAEIKRHYRWLVRWLHPDRNPDNAVVAFADRITRAWNSLRNPERRAEYDRSLDAAAAPVAPNAAVDTSALLRQWTERPRAPWLSARAVRRLPQVLAVAAWAVALGALGLAAWLYSLGPMRPASAPDLDGFGHAGFDPSAAQASGLPSSAPALLPERPALDSPASATRADPGESVLAPPDTAAASSPADVAVAPPSAPPAPEAGAVAAAAAQTPVPHVAAPSGTRAGTKVLAAIPPPPAGATESPSPRNPAPPPRGDGATPSMAPPVAATTTATATPSPPVAGGDADTAIAMAAPAPAAGDTSPVPTPLSESELTDFAGRLQRLYAQDRVAPFLDLFSPQARGNSGGYGELVDDYRRLFRERQQRWLALSAMHWQIDGDNAVGNGDYEAFVGAAADKPAARSHGHILLELQRGAQGLRIVTLRHTVSQ